MLGMGMGEMILVAGIALIIIGPERFPEFAKICMRTIRDLRSYVEEAKQDLQKEIAPLKKEIDQIKSYDPESYIDALTDSRDDSGHYQASSTQKTGESDETNASSTTSTEPHAADEKKPEEDSTEAEADNAAPAPPSPDATSPEEEVAHIPEPMDG
ncbi:MAG: twin-arginine translocase TatA/TatE family subunit [Candidatus Hydrogenedentales bacterium]